MSGRDPLAFDAPPEPSARIDPARRPEPPPRRPRRPAYGWVVGIAGLVLIAVVTLNTLRTDGVRGGGPAAGGRLPAFAVPLASSSLEGDANVAERRGQGAAGSRPACEVRGPDVLNSCELAERAPAVLALFTTRGGECADVLDQLERLQGRFPRVAFAAVASRSDRDRLRDAPRPFPVGVDRDGAVAARYGMAGCPQVTLVGSDGRVVDTFADRVGDGRLARAIRTLR